MGKLVSTLLCLTLAPSTASAGCEIFLEDPRLTPVKELVESSDNKDYIVTMNNERGLIIITSNYHPENGVRLERLLEELEIEFEILEFHGKTAYHVRR